MPKEPLINPLNPAIIEAALHSIIMKNREANSPISSVRLISQFVNEHFIIKNIEAQEIVVSLAKS